MAKNTIDVDCLKTIIAKLRASVELMATSYNPDVKTARELVSDSVTLAGSILERRKRQRGSICMVTLFCMTALFGFAALAVGTGQFYTISAEVQNCADAGALAGAQLLDGDTTGAVTAANQLVGKNGCEVVNAEIGWWDGVSFVAGQYPTLTWPANDSDLAGPWTGAVRVRARKAVVPILDNDPIVVERSATAVKRIKQDPDTLLWDLAKGSALVQ